MRNLPLVLSLLVATSLGCNLATDLDAYPYTGAIIIDDDQGVDMPDVEMSGPDMSDMADMPDPLDMADMADIADMADMDMMEPDLPPDMEPLVVKLRFTELLVDSSIDNNTELGEYIEITNVGTAPINPRFIQIDLVSSSVQIGVDLTADDMAEQQILSGIKTLMPGESFVFVRQDSPMYRITAGLEPGTFYEYGKWNSGTNIGLSNDARTIALLYPDPATMLPVEHDRLTWHNKQLVEIDTMASDSPLPVEENIAWSLDPFWYSFGPPSDASDWCYDPGRLTGTRLVRGSPGRAMTGPDCYRDAINLP